MNGLIAWWARNSVAANLLMFLILVVGVLMFFRIEREVFPSGKLDVVSVNVAWPGASPREVEEQIVLRLEEAVTGLDNVKEIRAEVREGSASLSIEMKSEADFDVFLNEVKSRIDGVSNLPQSSFPPVVSRITADVEMSFVTLTGDPEIVTEVQLNRLARVYRDELAQIPGGSPVVNIQGYRQEEVSVEVTEAALRRYGLTFDNVATAIRGSSLNRSMGEVRTSTGDVPLASRQLADSAEEFEQIVVRRNQDGSVIRVGDVATVTDGFPDANFIYRINGKPGRQLQVMQPETVNIVSASKAIQAWVDQKQSDLPPGIELKHQFTLAELYYARMELVSSNALMGLVLVLIILVLFLRPVVAFWVAAGIAISFIGTFIFLPAVGVSLNMLSLFAMLLVIGIVVDDALIVGESIHRMTERGKTGLTAAIVGTQIVIKPVVFAVLTTMIAFSPFLFIGGVTADFTKHIAWTIMFALTFSLIESFLILPAHLSHMKKPEPKGLLKFQEQLADSLLWFSDRFYRPLIKLSLAARYLTVFLFIGFFAISIALVAQGHVKFNFMPEVEQRFIQMRVDMQRGTPFSRTLQVYDQVEQAMSELDEKLEERNGMPIIQSREVWAWSGGMFVFLLMEDSDKRDQTLGEVGDDFRDLIGPIPDAEDVSINSTFSDNGNDRFVVSLESTDLEELQLVVSEIREYLGQYGELYDIGDSFEASQEELIFTLKPGADRFGLTIGEISRQVRQAFYGEEAQRLPRGGQDVRVMVRYPLETRESLESLSSMRIRTPDGREIALSAVADISYAPAVRRISRVDRKRSVRIWSRIRDGADAGPLRKEFYGTYVPQLLTNHPKVEVSRRGADQEQAEFMSNIMTLYIMALFGMYMLIAIGFGSYFQPILVLFAIPFGFMGAVFGHLLMGENFAMFSIFGICAAGGVVVNDNLVLVDYVNRLRKEGAGAFAALVEAGVVRFRPILLTSVTTFVGLVPIMLENSFDAKFLRPMVISLAFGVFFALFVTLIFVPAMYAVGVDIARFFRGLWTGEKQPALGEGDSKTHEIPDIDPHAPDFEDPHHHDGDGDHKEWQPAE
ncbi:efflux RND transporter permease subunit [Parvularcula marina]|uniref:AcrB/AcrD/AcrF family protein n=1 Tax=Parvularcula marina TaxID=2292771 RepID=A0A371RGX6_9PROT|nr:efflux RND transporter permease subunit [Parvularcula marina]RFB04706.1 AcrB/AcrD/AcrF family protein [Parvularcula marina]